MSFFKILLPLGFLTLVLIAILVLPVDRSLLFQGDASDRWLNLTVVLSGLYLLWLISSRFPKWIGIATCVAVVLITTLIRLLSYALVDFSGHDFGPELFVHLEPESLRIAWHEYGRLIRRALIVSILAVVCTVILYYSARKLSNHEFGKIPRLMTSAFALACVLILFLARNITPEWQLWVAWSNWQSQGMNGMFEHTASAGDPEFEESGISFTDRIPDNIDRWVDSGLVTIPPVINGKIQAEAIDGSENLILLYVEALTTSVITHEEYEDLMPGFRDLLNEHALIDDFYTSSHVTIEGIANTQCGLLFPFRGHGSGFAGREMLAEALPCLGDVLAAAGYHQSYILGGGPMSFTGKGDFLAAHGFNDLRGWEYWRARGFTRAAGHWGMGDIETLAQIRQLIIERRETEQPFNITTLTVGSHIPGYS